jgi:hypothetical protein
VQPHGSAPHRMCLLLKRLVLNRIQECERPRRRAAALDAHDNCLLRRIQQWDSSNATPSEGELGQLTRSACISSTTQYWYVVALGFTSASAAPACTFAVQDCMQVLQAHSPHRDAARTLHYYFKLLNQSAVAIVVYR